MKALCVRPAETERTNFVSEGEGELEWHSTGRVHALMNSISACRSKRTYVKKHLIYEHPKVLYFEIHL